MMALKKKQTVKNVPSYIKSREADFQLPNLVPGVGTSWLQNQVLKVMGEPSAELLPAKQLVTGAQTTLIFPGK